MVASEAQIAANRRNAQKSTGPKTPEGKERSRANSLKHGLCASVCVPEDTKLIANRYCEFSEALKPQNYYHTWLVDQATLASIRIDRAVRIERRVRDKIMLHAELNWDDERRMEAEMVGARLPRDPRGTVELLRRSPHGCDWLMGRWALLAHAADKSGGTWTDEQAEIAFDLLATPRAFRQGVKPGVVLDFDGREIESGDDPAAVARRMVAELRGRREVAADLDDVERALTERDLTNDSDKELRNLRRYESTLHKRLHWAIGQIKADTKDKKAAKPGLMPLWERVFEPEEKTEEETLAEDHPPESFQPPFDLEPDEYPPVGQKADIPKVLTMRRQKRIAKADARREAKRKKIDELLA